MTKLTRKIPNFGKKLCYITKIKNGVEFLKESAILISRTKELEKENSVC